MNRGYRSTVAEPARVRGLGLFTGERCAIAITPAESGGLVFEVDSPMGRARIPADIDALDPQPVHPVFESQPPRNTGLATQLAGGTVRLATVEHVLAALAGCGITDAVIEVDGPEIPIGDGSAAPFVKAIVKAGIREFTGSEMGDGWYGFSELVLRDEIVVEDGSARLIARPSTRPRLEYRLDYGPDAPEALRSSVAVLDARDREVFTFGIAPARTFSTAQEAEAMHALGLFTAFSPRDLLVLGPEGPIDNELRYPDEPARHKLLDLIGDLALLGMPLHAEVIAERTGHRHTHELVRRLRSARADQAH